MRLEFNTHNEYWIPDDNAFNACLFMIDPPNILSIDINSINVSVSNNNFYLIKSKLYLFIIESKCYKRSVI